MHTSDAQNPPAVDDSEGPVLTTREAARLLQVTERSVLKMVQEGHLPAHRMPGARGFRYLQAEVLDALQRFRTASSMEQTGTSVQPDAEVDDAFSETASGASGEIGSRDPCDVWGPAPTSMPGEDWGEQCRRHWVALAVDAGLSPRDAGSGGLVPGADPRAVGAVDVDSLTYQILVGPRQRVRCVDDEGDVTWALVESVWVEPLPRSDAL